MAPVVISSTGIPRQTIDNPELIKFIERVSTFDLTINNAKSDDSAGMDIDEDNNNTSDKKPPLDIDGLVDELKKCQRWRFQEQADLHEWAHPLNAIDAALNYFLDSYPSLLLIPRDRGSAGDNKDALQAPLSTDATTSDNVAEETPQHVLSCLECILTFLVTLLRNSINKTVFNSIFELSSLLASVSDEIASLALEALSALATPPMLHRQMVPELASHTTRIHSMKMDSILARRLMDMARGWGTKGSGLGLLQCINSAVATAGTTNPHLSDYELDDEKTPSALDLSFQCTVGGTLVSITLTKEQLILVDNNSTQPDSDHAKRQKTGIQTKDFRSTAMKQQQDQQFKSTAKIFQESLVLLKEDFMKKTNENGDSRGDFLLSPEKQFTLLSTIRLSRAFYQSSSSRVFAIKLRLRALITVLHTLSSVESITAYFMAQPELCGELVDLIRPTVSSGGAATSSDDGVAMTVSSSESESSSNSILALADSPQVPYDVRTLAIEALTALVARRDSAVGSFNIAARHANVLTELGVGKGQYLGLLPTLIRFSLAALNSFFLQEDANRGTGVQDDTNLDNNVDENNTGLELGLAFIRATKPPPLPKQVRQERALEFIDAVLTLTSAVISVPSGTSALTDCGIIPALVSTVALDSQMNNCSKKRSPFVEGNEESYSGCLLKFISAQAIQILEGAIVTHANALSAFHELKGVDVLVQRLHSEVELIRQNSSGDNDVAMEDVATGSRSDTNNEKPRLQGAQRVLLFSAVNCLTVVFHANEAGVGANAAAPAGGAQLRKPELMTVLLDIMGNVDSYGGVLAALVATFLSDVMNSDPQSVQYVHSSGLAQSFLSLILGKENEMKTTFGEDVEKWGEPLIEPSGELIMAVPNVISALCLTEAGVRVVADANPFPSILSVFCSPNYAMPNSRCLLSEMAAIIGSGLDEIMRHNPSLKSSVVKAVVQVMKRVVFIGKNLSIQEESMENSTDDLETARTQLMQYGHNVTQLLEQLVHNEDYISPFLNAGGFDVLLELARWSIIPSGRQLVAHASCLSCPSLACLTHSRTGSSLSTIVKTIASYNDPQELIKKICAALSSQLTHLDGSIKSLRVATDSSTDKDGDELVCDYILDGIPCTALYNIESADTKMSRTVDALSIFYRSTSTVDWLTSSLASVIKAAIHRTHELGLAQRRENGWKKEISSASFEKLVTRLSALHRSSLWEVCRQRTKTDFDERESLRSRASEPLLYKMRIVCQEGAIVRTGIDIDGCENVGSVEMGEVVDAFDRCINSSGVLRYQTNRGWISELTRGHGRENIVEVIDVVKHTATSPSISRSDFERIECAVPDLCSVSATVMTKLHSSFTNLFASLEKLMVSSIRSTPLLERSPLSINQNVIGEHVVSACRIMSFNLRKDLQFPHESMNADEKMAGTDTNFSDDAAKCMYFGNIINLVHTCMYEEKRDRRSFNIPLLLNMLLSTGWKNGISVPKDFADKYSADASQPGDDLLSAVQFVMHHSLRDMSTYVTSHSTQEEKTDIDGTSSKQRKQQRLSRAVASSLPPTLAFLKRLVPRSLLVESQISNALSRMKPIDYVSLLMDKTTIDQLAGDISTTPKFNAGRFARALHLKLATLTHEIWLDENICCAPAHILNPFAAYTEELMSCLDEGGKPIFSPGEGNGLGGSNRPRSDSRTNRILSSLNVLLGHDADDGDAQPPEPFEPNEETIERLSEMGFSRDNAIDALETVESNNVELAMEYLLAHPPSSPGTLERRRAQREQRRQRQQTQNRQRGSGAGDSQPVSEPNNGGGVSTQSSNTLPTNDNGDDAPTSKPAENKDTEKEVEEQSALEVKEYADTMRQSFIKICLDIIEGSNDPNTHPGTVESSEYLNGSKVGEGDSEGVTIIMTNFLLQMCKRSDDDASKIALSMLHRLKESILIQSKEQCEVKEGCETKFAAVAHAAVIMMRTIPKLRPLLLREGVVICLLHCVRNITTSPALRDGKSKMIWPKWLAPTLLLLEVMAQPTSVSLEDDKEADSDDHKKKGEFTKVLSEHKKQTSMLSKASKQLITTLQKEHAKKKKEKRNKQSNGEKNDDEGALPIQIPPFFPLILYEHAEQCMIMCLQLLGLRLKKASTTEDVLPPPGIVNSILVLLIRVVHSHKTASLCLQMGGADLVVALPNRCHFPGCSSLVTLLLRRLLEDEITLQTMMETEIRSQVTKIWRKNNPRSVVGVQGQPKASLKSFMKAVAPIVCRDPLIFMRAILTSVKIDPPNSGSTSLLSSRDSKIILLSPEQRIKNTKLLSLQVNGTADTTNHISTPTNKKTGSQEEPTKRGRGRSKSPHRSKNKLIQLNGSPASHVTSLLLRDVMKTKPKKEESSSAATNDRPFLSTVDYLDVLSDLVLAIPACGAAIHRYKPSKMDHFHHALSGCADPAQNVVSFLLHNLIPHPRTEPKDLLKEDESSKIRAFIQARKSQSAARLIVCLVARSGEGRRRVISDLMFALSGGRCPFENRSVALTLDSAANQHDGDIEYWALRSWGELCTSLSAPRFSNVNIDVDSKMLSFDVVKLMLDCGAAHSLMHAIERVNLNHSMAQSVASSLVKPLEILTRGSVSKTVIEMAEKEKSKANKDKESRRSTFGPSHRSESAFADDAMLEDGFDADSAVNSRRNGRLRYLEEDDSMRDNSDESSVEGDTDSMDDEVRLGGVDYSDDSEIDESDDDNGDDDEEESDSGNDDDDDESGDEDMEDDTENEDGIDDIDDEVFLDGREEEVMFDEENDFFGGDTEEDGAAMGAERGNAAEVDDAMEGWTRIDAIGGDASGANNGITLQMARALGLAGNTNRQRQGNDDLLGAAEAMLGNILRAGDVGMESLAEIEDTLGIRIAVRGEERGTRVGGVNGLNRSDLSTRNTFGVGVIQSMPPDAGNAHSSLTRGFVNANPMEYIFGGPAIVLGSQSYDVISNTGNERRTQVPPSSYDTQLFPGGLTASAHSRVQPRLHPLLSGLELPPLNSLMLTRESGSNDIDDSGACIPDSNRTNNPAAPIGEVSSAPSNMPLSGWSDDGLPPDSSTEGFITSMAQGLTTMFTRDLYRSGNSDETARGVENEASDPVSSINPSGRGSEDDETSNALADDDHVESNEDTEEAAGEDHEESNEDAVEAAVEDHEESNEDAEEAAVEDHDESNEEMEEAAGDDQPTQETDIPDEATGAASTDSGENVASSLANGLNISQPTSNDQVTNPDTQTNESDEVADNLEGVGDGVDDMQTDSISQQEQGDSTDVRGDTVDTTGPSSQPSPGAGETSQLTAESPPDDTGLPSQPNSDNDPEAAGDVSAPNDEAGALTCPPDVDPEVFASLPLEMQQEVAAQHNATNELVAQIPGSSLDPEALAALPEDMRREIIEQEQQQQRLREREAAQPAADPANAEEMDPASFLASLTPELRQDILLTADDTFLQGLPPNIQAEANALRERVVASHQRRREEANAANAATGAGPRGAGSRASSANDAQSNAPSRIRRQRNGKLRVETDKEELICTPENARENLGALITATSVKVLLNLLYMVSPLQPQRVVHKLLLNLCLHAETRDVILYLLTALLNNDKECIKEILNDVGNSKGGDEDANNEVGVDFPPCTLLGIAPDFAEGANPRFNSSISRRRNGGNASFTVSSALPASARGCGSKTIPPIVARRIISMLTSLSKSSPRIAFSMLAVSPEQGDNVICESRTSCMERLLDLLSIHLYSKSAANLEQLLSLLEVVASPLSLLPKEDQEVDLSSSGSSPGKEWVKVPRVEITEKRLHLLINTLRLESCKNSSFLKVNALTRRLSRVEANRDFILRELALVAQNLGADAIRDLRSVSVRLSSAAKLHQQKLESSNDISTVGNSPNNDSIAGTPSSAVSLSTGSSELKLLRVLQTLNSLCIEFADDENAKSDGYSAEFASLCQSIDLESLWNQLSLCLRMVSVLEGVTNFSALDDNDEDNNDEENENTEDTLTGEEGKKKLQNSVAGLITRFLPAIEAFFMVHTSSSSDTPDSTETEDIDTENSPLVQFVASNKVLLNALLRSNQHLLEKGLRAMVKMPKCRPFLDFDVKRQWFKTQVRRLRQQANRRHGSLRLNLRRKHVFEDSFHAFNHRSADELRGRLQITFVDEEGVDAGGLSREFFAILAKEMFNPNYALFMSTEDGCTFQPNPNSSINLDHLRYFRFVGRIVGKAVVDGFLLDAHFTRSLYKHMLGTKPTHHDMQAIDPDYYKNLQMILQHNLEDIGLELTFSTEDHSFGRSQTIDLIPNGRNIIVTEERKEEYVNLVCQHRMTTAIEKQIKAYLEGFHDMVDTDLISIFNAKELELLISGMPDIDIHDLKKNTNYNGYRPADKEIEWFWSIMFSLSRSEKAAFLQFVTGSAKVPLAGFSELQGMRGIQKFSINKATGSEGALMSAHTCFNALDLPVYKSEEEMKEKLLYAISEGAGGFLFA